MLQALKSCLGIDLRFFEHYDSVLGVGSRDCEDYAGGEGHVVAPGNLA